MNDGSSRPGATEVRVYNSLTGKKEEFVPLDPPRVGIYFCGMTVQGPPHVGHLRAALTGDIIRRWLRNRGYQVTYVQNFTDVEDKVIARAAEEGVDYLTVAERNIEEYNRYIDLLGIERPDFAPRPTEPENMKAILDFIGRLMESGHAYRGDDSGDVYFRVDRFEGYGKLSGRKTDELLSGVRVEVAADKESPLDFVLWKAAKPGEPSWDSPWGKGRPGWHIECSAMSQKYLGETIDIHGGGRDLVFPHHENEIAQSEALTGEPFARYWVHNGLVNITGAKMSKSTGKYTLAAELFGRFRPEVIRLYLLMTHYRHPMEFDVAHLEEAERAYKRLDTMVYEETRLSVERRPILKSLESAGSPGLMDRFAEAMNDDFNTAGTIGVVFETVGNLFKEISNYKELPDDAKRRLHADTERILELFNGVLGIKLERPPLRTPPPPEQDRRLTEHRGRWDEIKTEIAVDYSGFDTGEPPSGDSLAYLEWLIALRLWARAGKRWDLADRIRDDLRGMGISLEDKPEGTDYR